MSPLDLQSAPGGRPGELPGTAERLDPGNCDGTTLRRGTADLHVHTRASDAVPGVVEIIEHVEEQTRLDVVGITDHERIDAALAGREVARRRGYRVEVIVGEEVTTLGGHLLALFIERRIRPLRSLRATIREVHAQGGIAIASHPLAPYPNCVGAGAARRLASDADVTVRLDGLETFNPTNPGRSHHERALALAAELEIASVGGSDAHLVDAVGACWTTFPGRTADDLRRAILARSTTSDGRFWTFRYQVAQVGHQVRKYAEDIRDQATGTLLRRASGRDLGYPGGRRRPERFDPSELEQ
jgi:predicted metal-dependent phosphoesterase TrpH